MFDTSTLTDGLHRTWKYIRGGKLSSCGRLAVLIVVFILGVVSGRSYTSHQMDELKSQAAADRLQSERDKLIMSQQQPNAQVTREDLLAIGRMLNLNGGGQWWLGVVERIWLGASQVTDDDLQYMSQFANLVELDLQSTTISDQGLKHLQNQNQLQELNLDESPHITNDGMRYLPLSVSFSVF